MTHPKKLAKTTRLPRSNRPTQKIGQNDPDSFSTLYAGIPYIAAMRILKGDRITKNFIHEAHFLKKGIPATFLIQVYDRGRFR